LKIVFPCPEKAATFLFSRSWRWFALLLLACISLGLPNSAGAEPQQPLRVGSETDFLPYVDVDAQGQATGFAVELFTAVAAVMDIPISFHPGRWETVWQGLKTGKLDALPLVAHMPEREGQVEFTEPHTIGYDSFFVRKGRERIEFIEQARDLNIIVVRADAAYDALSSRGFNQQLVLVDSLADGFRLLASGQHDALLAPQLQGNHLRRQIGLESLIMPGPLLKEYRREFAFAVRKGDTKLRDRLNQGLAIVKANGEYDRLYRKWLGIHENRTFPVIYVAWGVLAALSLLALMGLWNWQLRRQVALRTQELTQAYTSVQAERQRLYDVLQALPVYVILLSQDYQVTFANRFFEQRYGKAQGRPCYQYLFGREAPCEVCDTFKVLKTGAPLDWCWSGPDGRDYEIHDFPFTDTDGSPMIMEVGIDITEVNRARQALRKANASLEQRVAERTTELEKARQEAEQTRDLLETVVNHLPAAAGILRASDLRLLLVNPEYQRLAPEREMVGKKIQEVWPEAPGLENLFRDVADTGKPFSIIDQLFKISRTESGPPEEIYFSWSIYRIRLPENKGWGLLVTAWETTQRKKIEEALRQSEYRLRRFYDLGLLGVIYWNVDGRIVEANDKFLEMVGYDREDLRSGRIDWQRMTPPEYRHLDEQALRQLMDFGAHSAPFEKEYICKDGTHLPVIVAGAMLDDTCAHGVAFVLDISERKRAEEILKETDRRKDEFLAMLAHELRNPLTPIRNAAQILKRSYSDETRLAWCSDVIDRQVDHLVRLVDDLLDISRINRGKIELKKERLEVSAIVQRAVETSQPLIESRRHTFTVRLPHEPIVLEGDLVRLSQAVSNLLTNAAKYTDEGGRIDLTVESASDEVFIRVRDNGRGIDPSALPDLFQLFYQVDRTLDRSEGGLGIGLSLVKNLVTMHGGEVWAYSEGCGQGSEFVIRLPNPLPAAEARVFHPAGSKTSAASLRILVVDDNLDAVHSLSLLLSSEGHSVTQAYDGHTAFAAALAELPQVILLDIGLPGMDGYTVAGALRQHSALNGTRLIALSGYGRRMDYERAKTAGFNAYLTKPVDFGELQRALTQPLLSDPMPS
jgi:PAS domain S-box-containing protein